MPIGWHVARGNNYAGAAEKRAERSDLAAFSDDGRRHCPCFFLTTSSEPDSPHWLIVRGRFAEAAEAFIRIMPEQREAVLQITDNAGNPGVANSVAPPKAPGIAILFSRRYRARTALVAVPWFLMDIATYGVGLFTPIILGAIDLSGKRVG